GVDAPTSLTSAILKHYGESSVEAMLYRFTARDVEHPTNIEVARLSRVVLNEAARGDATALGLVEKLGHELANYALAAARKVGIEHMPFTLVLNGGVFRHESTVLVDAILERIHAVTAGVQPIAARLQPVVGALLLAFEAGEIAVDAALIATVEESMPDNGLFET
ncbi:MAG: BadF/BadG/BcrA/BcrD ATPase family protein, partial [Chloroflexota bacterium]